MMTTMRQMFTTGTAILVLLQVTAFQPVAQAKERATPGGPPETAEQAARMASAFQKKHRSRSAQRFEELLKKVEAHVPTISEQSPSRRVASLREFLVADRELPDQKSGPRRRSDSTSRHAAQESHEIVYRFGARSFQATDPANHKLIRRLSKQPSLSAELLSAETRLAWMLRGALPETDLLVAALEAELDVHKGLDELALLLGSWKCRGPEGQQSFYQKLDWATRDGEAVFYPKKLVRRLLQIVAPRVGLRWSEEQQRERLYNSFLTYREYRGFIEAVAWSLTLPPNLSLPSHLARFDYGAVQGRGYSVRHEIDILQESQGGDSRAVVDAVRELIESRPLPALPWQPYGLAAEFNRYFSSQAQSIADRAELHTDTMGEQNRTRRLELSRKVATRVSALLAHL